MFFRFHRILDNLSIRNKLLFILGVSSAISVLTAAILHIFTGTQNISRILQSELNAVAQSIAQSSYAAVMFNDMTVLNRNITQLLNNSNVELVCVYDNQGSLISSADKNDGASRCTPESLKILGFLENIYPITKPSNTTLGTIHVYTNSHTVTEFIKRQGLLAILVFMGILLCVTLPIGLYLQRLISDPIRAIAHRTNEFSGERYSNELQMIASLVQFLILQIKIAKRDRDSILKIDNSLLDIIKLESTEIRAAALLTLNGILFEEKLSSGVEKLVSHYSKDTITFPDFIFSLQEARNELQVKTADPQLTYVDLPALLVEKISQYSPSKDRGVILYIITELTKRKFSGYIDTCMVNDLIKNVVKIFIEAAITDGDVVVRAKIDGSKTIFSIPIIGGMLGRENGLAELATNDRSFQLALFRVRSMSIVMNVELALEISENEFGLVLDFCNLANEAEKTGSYEAIYDHR